MAIERFRGDYYFLSSMYEVPGGIKLDDGRRVKTSENIYQAEKFEDPSAKEAVLFAVNGRKAKFLAKKLERSGAPIRQDWDEIKVEVMRRCVHEKFAADFGIALELIATGDEELIEGNPWKDTFWGVSPQGSTNGQNWLGRILMEERERLAQSFHNDEQPFRDLNPLV